MEKIRKNVQKGNRHVSLFAFAFAFAIAMAGMLGSAENTFGQKNVKIVEEMNQVTKFRKTAPVNTIRPAAQKFDQVVRNGNAAINNRVAIKAAQNRNLALKAGNAALDNRKAIQKARDVAKASKYARRAAVAGTGVGMVLVGGVWIAESVLGDSPDDIAIDAVASLAQGKRVDQVAAQVGKRLDPARLARNAGRNLNKTGRDISNAFNFIGRELGKIRL